MTLIPASEFRKLKRSHTKHEENVQLAVCNYLRVRYPDVIFTADSSGIKLTMGQAAKMKAMKSADCKFPDLIILEPRGTYHGLFLELKREGEKVFKADGEPYAGHVYEQFRTLVRLRDKAYKAEFAIGFDEAKRIIDEYMSLDPVGACKYDKVIYHKEIVNTCNHYFVPRDTQWKSCVHCGFITPIN